MSLAFRPNRAPGAASSGSESSGRRACMAEDSEIEIQIEHWGLDKNGKKLKNFDRRI